jgi:acetyl-CoA carboxylase biotin carboxyl carrier protein
MDLKVIAELIKMVGESKLSSLEVEEKDFRIKLEKLSPNIINDTPKNEKRVTKEDYDSNIKITANNQIAFEEELEIEQVFSNTENVDFNTTTIKSPIVGTFYLSSSQDSEPFVAVGKKVKKGEILCIIEAMKLMNEIECENDGEVVEILVENGQMVEYGQPLFKIK